MDFLCDDGDGDIPTAFAMFWAALGKYRRAEDMYKFLRLNRTMEARYEAGQSGSMSMAAYLNATNDYRRDRMILAKAPEAAFSLGALLDCIDVDEPAFFFARQYLRQDYMRVTKKDVEDLADALRRSDQCVKRKVETRSTRAQLAAVAVGQPAAKCSGGTTSRDTPRTPDSQPPGIKCYKCGLLGHIAKHCPKEKKVGGKQSAASTKSDGGKKPAGQQIVIDNSRAATSGAPRLSVMSSRSASTAPAKPRTDDADDLLIDSGSGLNIVPTALLVTCKPLDEPQTLAFGNGAQEVVTIAGELLLYLDEASAAKSGGRPFVVVKAWGSDKVPMPIISATRLAAAGVDITFSRDGHFADSRTVGGPRKRLDEQAKMKVWLARTASTALKSNSALVAAVAQPPGN